MATNFNHVNRASLSPWTWNQVMWLGLFRVHERVLLTSMNLHDESISVVTLVNFRGFESSDRYPNSHQQGVRQLEQDFNRTIEAVQYSQRTTDLWPLIRGCGCGRFRPRGKNSKFMTTKQDPTAWVSTPSTGLLLHSWCHKRHDQMNSFKIWSSIACFEHPWSFSPGFPSEKHWQDTHQNQACPHLSTFWGDFKSSRHCEQKGSEGQAKLMAILRLNPHILPKTAERKLSSTFMRLPTLV